jgi:hypothetical protein
MMGKLLQCVDKINRAESTDSISSMMSSSSAGRSDTYDETFAQRFFGVIDTLTLESYASSSSLQSLNDANAYRVSNKGKMLPSPLEKLAKAMDEFLQNDSYVYRSRSSSSLSRSASEDIFSDVDQTESSFGNLVSAVDSFLMNDSLNNEEVKVRQPQLPSLPGPVEKLADAIDQFLSN